jgi:hypothetical protein
MKILNNITKFFVSVILMTSLLLMFDIYHLFWWAENKLVDKFVLHFILSDNADVDYITGILKTNFKSLEFKEISYITKQQVYDEVKQKDELAVVLNVLKQNPFSDVIRIRIKNYSKKEFENLLSVTNSIPYVKQSLFDYNVKSYLDRIKELQSFSDLVYKIIFVIVVLTIIFYFLNIKSLKINLALTSLFSVLYVIIVLMNRKIVNLLTMADIIKFDLLNTAIFVVIYLFCILQIFELGNKNSEIQQ